MQKQIPVRSGSQRGPVQLAQTEAVQVAVAQSSRLVQCCPLPQRGQLPPQSTSLSLPFLTLSLQVGGGGGEVSRSCAAACFLAFLRHFFLASPDFFLHLALRSWAAASSPPGQPIRPRAPATSPPRARRREPAVLRDRVRVSKWDPSMGSVPWVLRTTRRERHSGARGAARVSLFWGVWTPDTGHDPCPLGNCCAPHHTAAPSRSQGRCCVPGEQRWGTPALPTQSDQKRSDPQLRRHQPDTRRAPLPASCRKSLAHLGNAASPPSRHDRRPTSNGGRGWRSRERGGDVGWRTSAARGSRAMTPANSSSGVGKCELSGARRRTWPPRSHSRNCRPKRGRRKPRTQIGHSRRGWRSRTGRPLVASRNASDPHPPGADRTPRCRRSACYWRSSRPVADRSCSCRRSPRTAVQQSSRRIRSKVAQQRQADN
jgi:hypothetical protein